MELWDPLPILILIVIVSFYIGMIIAFYVIIWIDTRPKNIDPLTQTQHEKEVAKLRIEIAELKKDL